MGGSFEGKGGQPQPPMDAEYEPVSKSTESEESKRELQDQPPAVESEPLVSQVENKTETKPQKAKIYFERKGNNEGRNTVLEERQQWLEEALTSRSGDTKQYVFETSLNALRGTKRTAETHKSLNSILHELRGNNKSLLDVLDRDNDEASMKALRLLGVSLVRSSFKEGQQREWNELSENEKRQVRLGELIGVEVERRMFEQNLANNTTGDIPQNRLEKAHTLYDRYSRSADIPEIFQKRFTKTSETLTERFGIGRENISQQKRSFNPERATSSKTVEQENIPHIPEATLTAAFQAEAKGNEETENTLRNLQEEIYRNNPGIRESFVAIWEGEQEYTPEFLETLKHVDRKSDARAEEYRQRFIDSLDLQMQYPSYKASRFNIVASFNRIEAVRRVFGIGGLLIHPFSRDRLMQVRKDVIGSMDELAKTRPDKEWLALQAAELQLMNIQNERRFKPTRAIYNLYLRGKTFVFTNMFKPSRTEATNHASQNEEVQTEPRGQSQEEREAANQAKEAADRDTDEFFKKFQLAQPEQRKVNIYESIETWVEQNPGGEYTSWRAAVDQATRDKFLQAAAEEKLSPKEFWKWCMEVLRNRPADKTAA